MGMRQARRPKGPLLLPNHHLEWGSRQALPLEASEPEPGQSPHKIGKTVILLPANRYFFPEKVLCKISDLLLMKGC
jgi:hypothetical protein